MKSPVRLLIIVKSRHADAWKMAWDEPQKFIPKVLKRLGFNDLVAPGNTYDNSDCRFMAIDRYDAASFMLVDLYNVDYNHEDAHLEGKNELPVHMVRVSQSRRNGRFVAKSKGIQRLPQVGSRIRDVHFSNGWVVYPPFKFDHANGAYPSYMYTRTFLPPGRDTKDTKDGR